MGIQHIGSRVSIREEAITLNAVPSSVYNKGSENAFNLKINSNAKTQFFIFKYTSRQNTRPFEIYFGWLLILLSIQTYLSTFC